jgi:hypothetical protein
LAQCAAPPRSDELLHTWSRFSAHRAAPSRIALLLRAKRCSSAQSAAPPRKALLLRANRGSSAQSAAHFRNGELFRAKSTASGEIDAGFSAPSDASRERATRCAKEPLACASARAIPQRAALSAKTLRFGEKK